MANIDIKTPHANKREKRRKRESNVTYNIQRAKEGLIMFNGVLDLLIEDINDRESNSYGTADELLELKNVVNKLNLMNGKPEPYIA